VQSDAAAIAEVHVAGWRSAYRDLLPADYLAGLSVDSRRNRWAEQLSAPSPTRTRVALVEGRVRGFASVGPCRDPDLLGTGAWELYAIYLDPTVVGQGIGRALLAASLGDVPRQAPVVSLWVLEGNTTAQAFYRAAGFIPDGQRQTIEIGGVSVVEVRYVRSSAS
jgi:ribosomal protein S18 acetylase RimI-like enzyme